ncbi:MAG: hypothetical protein ACREGC_01850 [Minisyncoccia bacterium]
MGAKNKIKKMQWRDIAIPSKRLTCWYQQGKVCYDKRGAISAKNLRYKRDRVELRIYWCEYCNFFHLTKRLEDIWENENNYRLTQKDRRNKVMSDDTKPEVGVSDLPADGQPVPTTAEPTPEAQPSEEKV